MTEDLEKEKAKLQAEKQQLQYQKADFERAQDELQAEKDEIEKRKLQLQKLEEDLFKQQAEAKELGARGIIAAVNEATMMLFQEDNKLKQKELELSQKESELTLKELKLKDEKAKLDTDRETFRSSLIARSSAYSILKDLPPPMNRKGKNESYPIVRFCYKTNFAWYKLFINHYADLCRCLRNIHTAGDISDQLKIQIVSVFHYKNFPAMNYADLELRVNRLVSMLKDIHSQYPHARLMELTRWFDHLSYPRDEQIPVTEQRVQLQMTQIPEPHFEIEEESDTSIAEDEEEIKEEEQEEKIEDRILQDAREQFENEEEVFKPEMIQHWVLFFNEERY